MSCDVMCSAGDVMSYAVSVCMSASPWAVKLSPVAKQLLTARGMPRMLVIISKLAISLVVPEDE